MEALKAAMVAGISEAAFFRTTPYLTRLRCEALSEQERNQYRHDLFTAWHAGLFGRVKKLPKLQAVMARIDRRRRQSPNEMLRNIVALNAAIGGKDKRKKVTDG